MSTQPFGHRWEITPQPLSRLDYIATAIYAAWNAHPQQYNPTKESQAVKLAKALIAELDKEQSHED